jgi:hypothetical protein
VCEIQGRRGWNSTSLGHVKCGLVTITVINEDFVYV